MAHHVCFSVLYSMLFDARVPISETEQ